MSGVTGIEVQRAAPSALNAVIVSSSIPASRRIASVCSPLLGGGPWQALCAVMGFLTWPIRPQGESISKKTPPSKKSATLFLRS